MKSVLNVEKPKVSGVHTRFDFLLAVMLAAVTAAGFLVLHSATRVMVGNVNGNRIIMVQAIGIALGVVIMIILAAMDYGIFRTLGIFVYGASLLLLVYVLLKGTGDNLGSRSWIRFGALSFQPSEVAKITFMVVVAVFLERIKEDQNKLVNMLKLVVYAGLPLLLIIAQKDFGTTIVFLFIFFVMIFAAGFPLRFLAIMGGAAVAALPVVWFFVLNENRKNRIRDFLDPARDQLGSGFNVIRSMMAIGSGGTTGQGLWNGFQTQNLGVPVKESDFIFSVVGEELGFVGACLIVVLLFGLILRIIWIAAHSRDHYGAFIAVGVAAMLAAHTIENVGMSIGMMPVTGIPLPFVSNGASNILANFMGIGFVMSISMRRKLPAVE